MIRDAGKTVFSLPENGGIKGKRLALFTLEIVVRADIWVNHRGGALAR
jgi:hypothetical protein